MIRILLVILIMGMVPVFCAETQEQTIERCIEDMASGDLQRRRRAAMVVGTYDTPEALQAAIRCLEDEDSQVRQSALVSLTEKRTLPEQARLPVIRLLRDNDVHIRRLSSSALPECFGLRVQGHLQKMGNIRVNGGAEAQRATDEEIQRLINEALMDEDALVCKNVLQAAFCYPFVLDRQKLERFLADESEMIRVWALQAYLVPRHSVQWNLELLKTLAQDDSAKVRCELARRLKVVDEAHDLVKILSADADSSVAVAAMESLAKLGMADGCAILDKALSEERFSDAQKERLCQLLEFYPREARAVLNKAMKQGGMLGDCALNMILSGAFGKVDLDIALAGSESSSMNTRRLALNYLRQAKSGIDERVLRRLLHSRYVDVRLNLIELLRNHSRNDKKVRDEIAMDLCADDDIRVRQNAFRLLSTIRPDGWTEVLCIALQEETSRDLRDAAAMTLCQGPADKTVAEALQVYLPEASPIIGKRIEIYLKRSKVQRAGSENKGN